MNYPKKLSPSFSSALRTFSFWIANGTVGHPLMNDIDYRTVMVEEPSLLEQAYAIFANVIELDEHGAVINGRHAEFRAAQYIRSYCDPGYVVDPPLTSWEMALF